MKHFFTILVLLCFSFPVLSDVFTGHCRDREPDLVADGKTCTGPVAELIETALKRIGHTVSWSEVPWKRSIEQAKNGKVDILPRHSMKPEREAFLHAVAYGYKIRKIYFMISPLKDIAIENFADLEGLKIGALRGSFYSDQFDQASNLIKKEMTSNDQIVKMLESGRLDVGLTSSAHEEEKFRALEGVKEAKYKDAFLNSRNISIPKASPMAKHFDAFAAEINKMAAAGEVDSIFSKYNVKAPAQK